MQHTNTSDSQLEILEKVPKNVLEIPLELYRQSAAIETYVKIPFFLVGVLLLIHNVFLAGNSYDYDTYDTIKTVELSIVGIIVFVVIVMAGMAINRNLRVNKHLKEISEQRHITLDVVQNEFNALATHQYGGRGVVLKK